MRTAWIVTAVIALVLALAGRADAGPRVAVIGDDAAVTEAVRGALGQHADVVDVGDAGAGDAETLAREHDLAVVVTVEVSGKGKGKRKRKAVVTARQGADGARIGSYTVRARQARLARDAGKQAWKKLGKAIKKARPPVVEPPPDPLTAAPPPDTGSRAESATDTTSETVVADVTSDGSTTSVTMSVRASTAGAARRGTPWLEVSAEGRTFLRTLRYNDDLNQTEREYELAAPAAGLTAVWRPKATGPARFFAVRGAVELAVGVNGSRTSDGAEYATSASEWSLGARAELPIGGARVRADVAYGEHRFSVDDDPMDELVPDTTYRWARGGLEVAIPVARAVVVEAGGGWRQLLGTGDLTADAWFPRATGAGLDATAGARWRVAGPVDLHARADLRRYFFAMNPEVGDPRIVGGAVDQYLAFVAGLSVALR